MKNYQMPWLIQRYGFWIQTAVRPNRGPNTPFYSHNKQGIFDEYLLPLNCQHSVDPPAWVKASAPPNTLKAGSLLVQLSLWKAKNTFTPPQVTGHPSFLSLLSGYFVRILSFIQPFNMWYSLKDRAELSHCTLFNVTFCCKTMWQLSTCWHLTPPCLSNSREPATDCPQRRDRKEQQDKPPSFLQEPSGCPGKTPRGFGTSLGGLPEAPTTAAAGTFQVSLSGAELLGVFLAAVLYCRTSCHRYALYLFYSCT